MKDIKRYFNKFAVLALVAVAAVFVGCLGPSNNVADNQKPLRFGVYVDCGARSIGAFRWVEIASLAENSTFVPIDAAAVRKGELKNVDILVMPGGNSVLEAKNLGAEGREKLKEFIRSGGGYMGTCAGCCLLMQSSKCHPNMLDIIPWTFGVCGGKTEIVINFNKLAGSMAGIKPGKYGIRYAEGPVPHPGKPVEGADIKVIARYAGDINAVSTKDRSSFAGCPAGFAGTYGKGRIIVTTVHPEVDVQDHHIVRGMIRYLTGREVTWKYPQRKRGQLSVGFVSDNSFGVETAKFISKILKDGEFDIIPVNAGSIAEGDFHHLDAVLAPDFAVKPVPEKGLFRNNTAATKKFLARGGKIIAWGASAKAKPITSGEVKGVVVVESGEEALSALRNFSKEKVVDSVKIPAKNKNPIRVAIYADKGGVNYTVAKHLKFSPEYEVEFYSAKDVREGALKKVDFLLQPGGGSGTQYKTLGEKGVKEVCDFVRNGGKYYGICAGSFLASQNIKGRSPRMGLVPFRDDVPEHYRGWGPINVKLTEEGLDVFGGEKIRRMTYWGGPVFIPGTPVKDTDVKVLGTYNGVRINTRNPKPVKPMLGKAAFLGGRVGKGKIFLSAPHPEKNEPCFDIVQNICKYLTGVKPTFIDLDRKRGAINVFFKTGKRDAARFYYKKLIADRRFDVRSGSSVDLNILPHTDVLIFSDYNGEIISDNLKSFAARGGKVILCGPKAPKASQLNERICYYPSYDKVIEEIVKL
jgi:glutamine amidotransferase-like uncharacterized protein